MLAIVKENKKTKETIVLENLHIGITWTEALRICAKYMKNLHKEEEVFIAHNMGKYENRIFCIKSN